MQGHVDPVCGMSVDPDRSAAEIEHDGTVYYFCGRHCAERFRDDPERYVSASSGGAEVDDEADPEALYTCPMHPELEQRGPGSCPKCGMALEPVSGAGVGDDDPELLDWKRRLRVALPLAAVVFVLAMGEMVVGAEPHAWMPWVQLVLAAPVVFYGGFPILTRMVRSLWPPRPNMFTLIGIGTLAAFGYSVVATVLPGVAPGGEGEHPSLYFESAAVIVALVIVGQILELRARRQTGDALRALIGLKPATARRLRADGGDEEVAIDAVAEGDRLRLRPGERVPVDGVVVEGTSRLDESMITGEPMPVSKSRGDELIGGTVNGSGALVMEAREVGEDTVLAQIIERVRSAQRSRAPIQSVADRVSAVFVPVVIACALAAFALWLAFGPAPRLPHALSSAVAVLIIACPCALGLAVPVSIMVAMGRGANVGVLFRDAEAIQRLADVDTLVVDKTGTLTEGRPKVTEVLTTGETSRDEVIALAAALERSSEHPLGAAIVAADERRSAADATDVEVTVGSGISGLVDGRAVAVGNEDLMTALAPIDPDLARAADEIRGRGGIAVFVAIDRRPTAVIEIADPLRPDAAETVRRFAGRGVKLLLLTGDAEATAREIAREVGIDEVIAKQRPEDKAREVKQHQEAGGVVAMAGDGINDAPALAQANVGIAMGTGTAVAMETAQITLLGGDLRGGWRAFLLARATMRNIRQNLAFALGYNALCIPLAAGALYPWTGWLLSPMIAAVAMSLSSLSVIANALRLRRASLE